MSARDDKRPSGACLSSLFLRLATRELQGPASGLQKTFRALAQESDPWKAREEMQEVSESVDRLCRLIETLSDTADIEARRVRLEMTEVNLALLFNERIGKRLWRFPAFRFLPEMPSRLAIRGDRPRLAFLVDDLLDAAIHIAPGGGIIHALLARQGEEVVLSTRNRGAALPHARFASFIEWMAEDVENPGALQGIGIHLYRSYHTARMLGGGLEIAAPPEGGASFTVRFPIDAPRRPPTTQDSPSP